MTGDDKQYNDSQDKKFHEWEGLCRRCGACCGSIEGDPCSHLMVGDDQYYGCAIYSDRFGLRHTVSGREFYCVPIRNVLHQSWPGDIGCAYKKVASIFLHDNQ